MFVSESIQHFIYLKLRFHRALVFQQTRPLKKTSRIKDVWHSKFQETALQDTINGTLQYIFYFSGEKKVLLLSLLPVAGQLPFIYGLKFDMYGMVCVVMVQESANEAIQIHDYNVASRLMIGFGGKVVLWFLAAHHTNKNNTLFCAPRTQCTQCTQCSVSSRLWHSQRVMWMFPDILFVFDSVGEGAYLYFGTASG